MRSRTLRQGWPRFLGRRLGTFALTLWVALTVNFILPRLVPGNPALALLARSRGRIDPVSLRAVEIAFGLDQHTPLPAQYLQYLANAVTGRFGVSIAYFPLPVGDVVLRALPWTLGLVGVTTVLAFLLGTAAGLVAGWRRGGIADLVLPPVLVVAGALPYFWVGMILVLVLSVGTGGVIPDGGAYDITALPGWNAEFVGSVVLHALLPAATILVVSTGGWVLTMRNTVVTVLAEEFIRTARAKGLSSARIMVDYAGRNALLPNLAGFAISIGFVVSGSILVEYTFDYPGIGSLLLQATQSQDYPLMQAVFMMITVSVLVAVLLSEVLTAALDPRVRAEA